MFFTDSQTIKADVASVYEFFSNTDIWQMAVPHCNCIKVLEESNQGFITKEKIEMNVTSKLGHNESFITERWKVRNHVITYNQLSPPEPIIHHSGEWHFEDLGNETKITSVHIVFVDNTYENYQQYKNYSFIEIEDLAKQSILHNSKQIIDSCYKFLTRR